MDGGTAHQIAAPVFLWSLTMAYNVTAQLNLQLNPQSLNQIAQALNSITNGRSIGGNLFNSNGIKNITAELNNSKNAMVQFGEQAGLAAKRFGAFTLTAGSFVQVTQGFRAMLNEAIAFDREMVKLKQVSADTASSGVGAIREEIDRLSTGLGVSSSQLARVSVILKQANLNLGETKTALEALALSALAPNFDSMEKTAEGAIAVLKQFKIPVEELKSSLGSINAVAGEFAVEASDLIGVIQRTGGAFKAAGGNLNELLALFTSVRQTTRESAESISTGLRTIFTRIQRTGTADALREVGVNLRYTRDEALALGNVDLTSQFVGAYEAVRRLSVALNQIPATDPKFAQLVEELGGYRQISKVIPLIQEFSISQQALNTAITGGTSLMNSAAAAQGSFGNRLDKLKESYLQFGRTLLDSSSFKTLFTAFETGAQAALVLMNALKPLLPMITMLATIKMAQGVGSFGAGFFQGMMPAKKSGGGPLRFKKGGIVPGSGSGDIVPAMLEPGEMVIPKRMVKKYAVGGAHTADIEESALNNPAGFNAFMQGSQTINPKTGKHRRFFHGTRGQDFDSFGNKYAKSTWFGRGHYFSADANVASRYSGTHHDDDKSQSGARVISAALSAKKSYTWNSDKSVEDFFTGGGKKLKLKNGQFDQGEWNQIVDKGVFPEEISQGTFDHLNKIFTKFPSVAKNWSKMTGEEKRKFVAHGATQTLKKQGYDSVNVDYGLGNDYFNTTTVFSPKQIKSLGNEGGWNPSLKEIGKNLGGYIGRKRFYNGGDILKIARASGMYSLKEKFNVGLKDDYYKDNKIVDKLQNNIDAYKTFDKGENSIESQLGTRDSIIAKAKKMSQVYGMTINKEDLDALSKLKTKGVTWDSIIQKSKDKNNPLFSQLSDQQKNILKELEQKNSQIKSVNEFAQFVGLKELDLSNPNNQKYNKFAGAIGEKQISKKNQNYIKLQNEAGADFYIPNTTDPYEFVEVKTNISPVSDDILRAKALLGFAEISKTNFKNTESENIPQKIKINYQQALASGGFIVPGVGDTDSVPMDLPVGSYVIKKSSTKKMGFANGGAVPALLTPGELVIDPKTASGIGQAKLDHMNRTGRSAFAKGGRVGFAWGGGSTPDMFNVGSNPLTDARLTDQFSKMTPVMQNVIENLARLSFVFGRTATVEESYNQAITEITELEKNREALKGMAPGTAAYTAMQSSIRGQEFNINNRLSEAEKAVHQDPGEQLARARAKEEINKENPSITSNLGDEINQRIVSIKVSSQRAQIEKEYLDVVQMQIKEAYPLLNAEQQGALALEMLNEARIKGTMAINASTKAVEGDTRLAAMGHSGADLIAAREAEKNKPKESIFKRIGNFITGDGDDKLTEDQKANRKSQRLMAASMAFGVASSYTGAFFENMGGTAKEAAEGKTGSYAFAKGAGGMYQGAAMGGTLAMSMGATPLVGAIVGAGAAIVSGIESYIAANKQVLEEIVNVNQEKFTALTTKMMEKQNSVDIRSLNDSISELSTSAADAAGASTGILEALGMGGSFLGGRSEQKIREDKIAAAEKAQQQNAPQISNVLTKSLSQQLIAGGVQNKKEVDFYNISKGIINVSSEFQSLIWSSRQVGESFEQARARIIKAASGIAQIEAAKQANLKLLDIINRSADHLKVFADNLEGVSIKIGQSFKNFDNAISAFEGGNRINKSYDLEKNAKIFANPSAFSSKEFETAINSTFSNFPSEIGANIAQQFAPMADISNRLPEVLAHAIHAENPVEDFMSRMEVALGDNAKDPQVKAILSGLANRLSSTDNIQAKGANALAVEMSSSILDPIKTYGLKINELNSQIAESLISSFTKLNQSTLKLIEGYEKADQLLFNTLETQAKAQHIMMGGSGDIGAKPMAVAQLQAIQQKRYLDEAKRPELLGNTAGIGEALRKAMNNLIENQKKSNKDFKGGEIERTATLAGFDKQIDNFKKALEHVISGELAVAAEFGKLAQEVGRQRNAGASLSKRLAMGGPEEQFKFMQGSRIFQGVMSGQISAGQVLNNPMLAKILDEFAQMTGEMKINGLTAQEHLNARIYEPHAQMAFGVPGRGVEANLVNEQAKHEAEAAKAQEQLNKAMQQGIKDANKELIASQDRLKQALDEVKITEMMKLEQQKTVATPEMAKQQQAVNTIKSLDKNNTLNQKDLESLADPSVREKVLKIKNLQKMKNGYKDLANLNLNVFGKGGRVYASEFGDVDDTRGSASKAQAENITEHLNLIKQIQNLLGGEEKSPIDKEEISLLIKKSFGREIPLNDLIKQKIKEKQELLDKQTEGQNGQNALRLTNTLSANPEFSKNFEGNLTKLSEAITSLGTTSFKNAAESVAKFVAIVETSTRNIEKMKEELRLMREKGQGVTEANKDQAQAARNNANAQNQEAATRAQNAQQEQANAVKGKANGGLIKPFGFSKGGVVPGHGNQDTVPAMLTPGEIVLPKRFQEGGLVNKKLEDLMVEKYGMNKDQFRKKYGTIYKTPIFDDSFINADRTRGIEQLDPNAGSNPRNIRIEDFDWNTGARLSDEDVKFGEAFGKLRGHYTIGELKQIAAYYGADAVYAEKFYPQYRLDHKDLFESKVTRNMANMLYLSPQERAQIAESNQNENIYAQKKYAKYKNQEMDKIREKYKVSQEEIDNKAVMTQNEFEKLFGSNLSEKEKLKIYDLYGAKVIPTNEFDIGKGTFNGKPSLRVQQIQYEKDRQARTRLGNGEELINGRWYKKEKDLGASAYVGERKNEIQPSLYQQRNINKYGPESKGRDPIDTTRRDGIQPNLYDQRFGNNNNRVIDIDNGQQARPIINRVNIPEGKIEKAKPNPEVIDPLKSAYQKALNNYHVDVSYKNKKGDTISLFDNTHRIALQDKYTKHQEELKKLKTKINDDYFDRGRNPPNPDNWFVKNKISDDKALDVFHMMLRNFDKWETAAKIYTEIQVLDKAFANPRLLNNAEKLHLRRYIVSLQKKHFALMNDPRELNKKFKEGIDENWSKNNFSAAPQGTPILARRAGFELPKPQNNIQPNNPNAQNPPVRPPAAPPTDKPPNSDAAYQEYKDWFKNTFGMDHSVWVRNNWPAGRFQEPTLEDQEWRHLTFLQEMRLRAEIEKRKLTDDELRVIPMHQEAAARLLRIRNVQAQKKMSGGLIYKASGGSIFKPQGTDTVPAMLTPGEFVMRKSAVDKIGATKLSQMNNSASYFAGGGMVNSNTSLDQSTSFNQVAASFNGFINSFNISVDTFNNSVESFGEKVQQFSQAVSVMPATLTVNGQVGANVTTNAAGIVTQISNVVQNMISSEIKKALSNNVSLDQRSRPS